MIKDNGWSDVFILCSTPSKDVNGFADLIEEEHNDFDEEDWE